MKFVPPPTKINNKNPKKSLAYFRLLCCALLFPLPLAVEACCLIFTNHIGSIMGLQAKKGSAPAKAKSGAAKAKAWTVEIDYLIN